MSSAIFRPVGRSWSYSKTVTFGSIAVLCYMVSAPAQSLVDVESSRFDEALIWRTVDSAPVGFFSSMTMPTEPVALSRLATDWDRASAFLVNLPLSECLNDPEMLAFYRELIEIVSKRLPVVVGHDDAEIGLVGRMEDALGLGETGKLTPYPVEFVESRSRSYWIRDYGPIFGFGKDGVLVVIDPIFGDWVQEFRSFVGGDSLESFDNGEALEDYIVFKKGNRKSDIAPLVLTSYFRKGLKLRTETTRPPLLLMGGNFLSNGDGIAAISEETVLANGGLLHSTESLIKAYFGTREMLLLESNPSLVAERIDSQITFLDERSILVSQPPKILTTASATARFLSNQIQAIYESNSNRLRKEDLDLNIVTIPSLPLREEPQELAVERVRQTVLETACTMANVSFEKYLQEKQGKTSGDKRIREIDAWLQKLTGTRIDVDSPQGLAVAAAHVLERSLSSLVEERRGETLYERSYVNGLVINLGERGTLLLLPRYQAADGENAEVIRQIEGKLEDIYRKVHPPAEIHWINADVLASRGASLRRVGMVVPSNQRRDTE